MFSGKICIGGLPGVGSVGKVAADYLSTALDCSTLRSFFSSGFPAQVMVGDGVVEMLHAEFQKPSDRDNIIVLSGDAQPTEVKDMYILAGEILEAARVLGIQNMITLAAYVGESSDKVVGVASDAVGAQSLEKSGIHLLKSGAIGGINGLLAGMAPLYGMRGFCLLGTTSGDELIDLKATNNLLAALKKVLDLNISIDGLLVEDGQPEKVPFQEEDMNYR